MSISQSAMNTNRLAVLLFVDDDPNVLKSLLRLFYQENYSVYLAANGSEGLAILHQHTVDLVISDLRMPEMNGAEFLSQVVEHWPDTIRILLTGYAELQSTIHAVNKGRIFFSRPLPALEVEQLFNKCLFSGVFL